MNIHLNENDTNTSWTTTTYKSLKEFLDKKPSSTEVTETRNDALSLSALNKVVPKKYFSITIQSLENNSATNLVILDHGDWLHKTLKVLTKTNITGEVINDRRILIGSVTDTESDAVDRLKDTTSAEHKLLARNNIKLSLEFGKAWLIPA